MAKAKKRFPVITEAIRDLCTDSGCCLEFQTIVRWLPQLARVEAQLKRLSRKQDGTGFSEFNHFVFGDEEDQKRLRTKYKLQLAHKFLNDVFHGR